MKKGFIWRPQSVIINKLAWNNDSLLKFEGVTYQYTGRRNLKLSHSFTVLSVLVKLKARKVKTLAVYCPHHLDFLDFSAISHSSNVCFGLPEIFLSYTGKCDLNCQTIGPPLPPFPSLFPLYYVLSTAIEYIVPLLSISPIKQFYCN